MLQEYNETTLVSSSETNKVSNSWKYQGYQGSVEPSAGKQTRQQQQSIIFQFESGKMKFG